MTYNSVSECNGCGVSLTDKTWGKYNQKRKLRRCKTCELNRTRKYRVNISPEKRDAKEKRRKIGRLKLRLETMFAYGNKCKRCGENKILFLTLDHINNNGYLDRDAIGGGISLYAHLKRLGYPGKDTQVQILCHNCNANKEIAIRASAYERCGIQEVYIKQEYSLASEIDKQLWKEAKDLYNKLNCD